MSSKRLKIILIISTLSIVSIFTGCASTSAFRNNCQCKIIGIDSDEISFSNLQVYSLQNGSHIIAGKVIKKSLIPSVYGHIDIAITDNQGFVLYKQGIKQSRPFFGRGNRKSSPFSANLGNGIPENVTVTVAYHKNQYKDSFDCNDNKAVN